jgi:hypothetical protein
MPSGPNCGVGGVGGVILMNAPEGRRRAYEGIPRVCTLTKRRRWIGGRKLTPHTPQFRASFPARRVGALPMQRCATWGPLQHASCRLCAVRGRRRSSRLSARAQCRKDAAASRRSPFLGALQFIRVTERRVRNRSLGWVCFTLDSRVRADGIAVRRPPPSKLWLSSPARPDRLGRDLPLVRPRDKPPGLLNECAEGDER